MIVPVQELKKNRHQRCRMRPYIAYEEEGGCWVEREPPLQVYCDYEAITDEEGIQTPILLCLEDDKTDDTHFLYGPTCTANMFEHLESLVMDTM